LRLIEIFKFIRNDDDDDDDAAFMSSSIELRFKDE